MAPTQDHAEHCGCSFCNVRREGERRRAAVKEAITGERERWKNVACDLCSNNGGQHVHADSECELCDEGRGPKENRFSLSREQVEYHFKQQEEQAEKWVDQIRKGTEPGEE